MSRKSHTSLRFEQLVAKVQQAEDALEAQERSAAADLRQLKSSWRAAWTPWRIVVAGVVSGFVVGRAEPLRALGKSGGLMQMVSMVASLVADEATETKEQVQAEAASGDLSPAPGAAAPVAAAQEAARDGDTVEEALALAQAEIRARAARTATVDQVSP